VRYSDEHGMAIAYWAIGLFELNIPNFPKILNTNNIYETHEQKIKKARDWYTANKGKIVFDRSVY
ncbi:MAG: hypothetical protein ACRCVT_08025, partial [Leadbetterella sp.]